MRSWFVKITEVRERLIAYFDLLGPDDERVGPARREMARALTG